SSTAGFPRDCLPKALTAPNCWPSTTRPGIGNRWASWSRRDWPIISTLPRSATRACCRSSSPARSMVPARRRSTASPPTGRKRKGFTEVAGYVELRLLAPDGSLVARWEVPGGRLAGVKPVWSAGGQLAFVEGEVLEGLHFDDPF